MADAAFVFGSIFGFEADGEAGEAFKFFDNERDASVPADENGDASPFGSVDLDGTGANERLACGATVGDVDELAAVRDDRRKFIGPAAIDERSRHDGARRSPRQIDDAPEKVAPPDDFRHEIDLRG